jgi:lysophospholipase L1-like esterase
VFPGRASIFLVLSLAILVTPSLASAESCDEANSSPTVVATQPTTINPTRMANVQRQILSSPQSSIGFGDSIMQGWPENLLSKALNHSITNAGFGGDGTENTLWRLGSLQLQQLKPTVVILLLGTNDLGRRKCDVYSGEMAVVGQIKGLSVVMTSILPRGVAMADFDEKIRSVNSLLESEAKKHDYYFFDAHDAFLCQQRTPCSLYQDNNLHLTQEGYEQLSLLLEEFRRGKEFH